MVVGGRGWSLVVVKDRIYLGDIFLSATDKVLSRDAGRPGAPAALAIIYQVPKTCSVVRFYLHEYSRNTAAYF